MSNKTGKVFIITSEQGSGKTTFCSRLIERLSETGIRITGVLCPGEFSDANKTGINMVDIQSGTQHLLAVLREENDSSKVTTHRWSFNEDALTLGNRILGMSIPCDLLIVDELGPLEFERDEGWGKGLTAVDSRKFNAAVVVVRPELVGKALQRWPDASIIKIDVENRDKKLDALVKCFVEIL